MVGHEPQLLTSYSDLNSRKSGVCVQRILRVNNMPAALSMT